MDINLNTNNTMKRTVKMLALVAVAAGLVFASCQKEDSNNTAGNGSNGGTNGGGQTAGEWVDLGLPSGLLWATCNLGATTPEGYGDYYAWGETATKDVYNWSTYKYCTVDADGDLQTLTKYNTSTSWGTPDNLTTLEAMDDVAAQKLGAGARMPTAAEWRELINNTTAEWTQENGVNGRKFTASNGKSLFLPAAGRRWVGELYDAGSYGLYWSSSLVESYPSNAWYFSFGEGGQGMDGTNRYYGLSVRAVRSQN